MQRQCVSCQRLRIHAENRSRVWQDCFHALSHPIQSSYQVYIQVVNTSSAFKERSPQKLPINCDTSYPPGHFAVGSAEKTGGWHAPGSQRSTEPKTQAHN